MGLKEEITNLLLDGDIEGAIRRLYIFTLESTEEAVRDLQDETVRLSLWQKDLHSKIRMDLLSETETQEQKDKLLSHIQDLAERMENPIEAMELKSYEPELERFDQNQRKELQDLLDVELEYLEAIKYLRSIFSTLPEGMGKLAMKKDIERKEEELQALREKIQSKIDLANQ